MRCKAKSKRTGQQCGAQAVTGSDVCYHHGGKTPKGAASPHFKTGKHSRYAVPINLVDSYHASLADTDLHDQRQSIALIDTLINQMLPNIETADNGKAWEAMRRLVADIRYAYKSENYAKLEEALGELEDWANLRIKHYETIEEIRVQLDTRRKHVETEKRIELAKDRAITAEQAMILVTQILSIITSVVTDRTQRSAIAYEINRLITLPAPTIDAE